MAMDYIVSIPVNVDDLRKPGPLFPDIDIVPSKTTVQHMVKCDATLQAATSMCTVRTDDPETPMESEFTHSNVSMESVHSDTPLDTVSPPKADENRMRSIVQRQLIDLYIEQEQSSNANVHFDKIAVTASNEKTILLSSNGLNQGIHEWNIEIVSTDVDLQEIGVIGTDDIDRIPVSDLGAMDTEQFKSRALYGNEIGSDALFYGSWKANGKARCHRDLRPFFKTGWTEGDVITVKLDLDKWRIKFFLNGQSVRYTMTLDPKKVYFPMICFSGNCKFSLH